MLDLSISTGHNPCPYGLRVTGNCRVECSLLGAVGEVCIGYSVITKKGLLTSVWKVEVGRRV